MLLLAFSLTYYIGVRVGFAFTLSANAVSLLWTPNAILLAALLICPPRTWGWLLFAALPAHLVSELAAGVPLLMASCWYFSNLSEALLGAAIIRAVLGGTPRFDRLTDASVYLLGGVLIAPVLTSFLDAGFVALVGWRYDGDYWAVFRMRLLSNALVALIIPPLVITLLRPGPFVLLRARRALQVEAMALVVLLCAVCIAAFHYSTSASGAVMYVCAPLPLLLWAAVRMGVGGVSACVAIVALLAITGTLRGTGPFVLDGPDMSVLALHVFLIIIATSVMLLAAALAELRAARAAALQREERLDLALSAGHMGAWEWDLVADTISWRWGMDSGEVSADGVRSAGQLLAKVHEHDRGRVAAAMRAARASGKVEEVECRLMCNGRMRWIRGFGKVQVDRAGMRHAVIGVCIDTTQRKQFEMQQRSQRESLAHLARAATLGELSGSLTHELSQPLAAILINTHTARQELRKTQPRMHELQAILEDIAADDERASAVISRLRALFPRNPAAKQQVQIAECIGSILALEHSDLITRNVAVDLSIDPTLPLVTAAHEQLQQVLLNLIVNACEAMARTDGERRLRIAAQNHAGEVRVEVSDNGSGVADFQRIFEPFYSTKEQGVGLGLPIARTIIAEHGGRLWGSNNAVGGATFYIALPAAAMVRA
ncbi:MAG TPA: MASE1 domain-containing protein [Steroidobacteraceae bacterium]|jgi:signal transduction histidine kinase